MVHCGIIGPGIRAGKSVLFEEGEATSAVMNVDRYNKVNFMTLFGKVSKRDKANMKQNASSQEL